MRLILLMKDVRMGSLKRKRGTFMENKVHFKLHKVKKQWVTIAAVSYTHLDVYKRQGQMR